MNPTPALFGFLLGAGLGVLVTDLTPEKLRAQIADLSPWAKLSQRWRGLPKGSLSKLCWFLRRPRKLRWLLINFRHVEWIGATVLVFLAVFLMWFVEASYHPLWLPSSMDGPWFRQVFIGSLIGGAAAPWIWAHFARNDRTRELAPDGLPTESPAVSMRRRPQRGHSGLENRLSRSGLALWISISPMSVSMAKSVNAITPSSPRP
jgi:hypothetical protein